MIGGAIPASAARVDSLPKSMKYTFYIGGQPAGHSEIHLSRTPSSLIFNSTTRAGQGENVIELTCRTVADPQTFEVRSFSYKGTKGGSAVASDVHVSADSVYGTTFSVGTLLHRKQNVRGRETLIFEDWVVELQILLALRQERATRNPTTYRLVLANSFLPTDAIAGYTGEVLVEAPGRSVVASKLAVAIAGGPGFESQVDPKLGIPVCLVFPSVRTEIFLNEFFGENPSTRFPAKASPSPNPTASGGSSGN